MPLSTGKGRYRRSVNRKSKQFEAMTANTILITGASSGVGAGLALEYAAPGRRLILWARDEVRLALTAAECRDRGAQVVTNCFDLTNFGFLVTALDQADASHPIDVAIFNAGLGGSLPREAIAQEAESGEQMAGVNFTAPSIAANRMAQHMAPRGKGRIVLVSSIAAAFPLPMAPLYSGSKAGLEMFAAALRARLRRYGVAVTVVCPGFIDTPMSRSLKEPRPFLISAEKAATIIRRGIDRGAGHITLPWQFALVRALGGLVPGFVVRAVLALF